MKMTREEATRLVDSVTVMHNQYQAVSYESCRTLLGDRFDALLADPVRRLGPTDGTIYPWNIIDYMSVENPRPRSNS